MKTHTYRDIDIMTATTGLFAVESTINAVTEDMTWDFTLVANIKTGNLIPKVKATTQLGATILDDGYQVNISCTVRNIVSLKAGDRTWVEWVAPDGVLVDASYTIDTTVQSLDTGLHGGGNLRISEPETIVIFEPANQNIITLHNNNEERIRINCASGEINFKPDMKDEYKQMWLMLQRAFPQAFDVEPHKEQIIEESDDAYDRAMGVFK